jgi:hypothetical protein
VALVSLQVLITCGVCVQRKVWCRCDFAFSTFLLGHHPQQAAQQQAEPQPPHAAQPHALEELPV